jgi:cytochrome b561
MKLRNSEQGYGWPAILIHWLMAIAIFGLFGLGLYMTSLGYYDAWYQRGPYIHQSIGMLMLMLLAVRFAWRLANTRPQLLGRAWERLVAITVHRTHYLLMLLVMVSGYLIPTAEGKGFEVFGWFTVPALLTLESHQVDLVGAFHLYSAWALVLLAGLHAAAALKHHFIDRDATLRRMLVGD